MSFTGDLVTAMATNSFKEDTGGSTTSTVYGPVGPTMGIAFIAPASGRVTIHFGTAGFNSAAVDNKTSVAVRNGGSVGSGTVFQAANDNNMILFTGVATYRINSWVDVSGLTAGNTYNAQMEHRTGAGTGTWLYRSLTVVPQI